MGGWCEHTHPPSSFHSILNEIYSIYSIDTYCYTMLHLRYIYFAWLTYISHWLSMSIHISTKLYSHHHLWRVHNNSNETEKKSKTITHPHLIRIFINNFSQKLQCIIFLLHLKLFRWWLRRLSNSQFWPILIVNNSKIC